MSRLWILSLASKNIRARPFRNAILVAAVAAVAGMQVSGALLERASRRSLELGIRRLGADLVAVPFGADEALTRSYLTGDAATFYMDRSVREKIAGFPFVAQTSSQLFLKSLSNAGCCSLWNIYLVGFEPESDFAIRPWLADHPERPLGTDEALVGAAIGVEPGGALKFFGHDFRVAGTLSKTGMGLDSAVFIPLETAYLMAKESASKAQKALEISPDRISAVLIKLKPEGKGGLPAYKAAFELEKALPEISMVQPDDLAVKTRNNLSAALAGLRSAGYVIWPVTAALIALVFALAANERKRELGIMRSVGASRGFVFRMIIMEALIITAMGAVLGLLVSIGIILGFSGLIAARLSIPFLAPPVSELFLLAAAALILAMLTGAVAAFFPAFKAARMAPAEARKQGE